VNILLLGSQAVRAEHDGDVPEGGKISGGGSKWTKVLPMNICQQHQIFRLVADSPFLATSGAGGGGDKPSTVTMQSLLEAGWVWLQDRTSLNKTLWAYIQLQSIS
jgi:hypothetical protein